MRVLSAYVNLVPALAPRSPTGGITMAKNKNRKQSAPQSRSSQTEKAQEKAERSAPEERQSPAAQIQGGPADVARKQQKRFGHN
jgi:hypothetical protein